MKEQWKYSKVVNKTWSVSLKNGRVEKKQLAPFAVSFSLREKFPNTKFFWSVFLCIQTECWKIRTKKTPYLDTFHAVNFSVCLNILWKLGLLGLILEMCPFFQKLLIKKFHHVLPFCTVHPIKQIYEASLEEANYSYSVSLNCRYGHIYWRNP